MFENRPRVPRLVMAAVLVAGTVLTGCVNSGVRFTNVSDTWLNVSFFVGTSEIGSEKPEDLYRQKSLQIEPGATARYKPTGGLVHVQVETVTPTWTPTGRAFWLEVLTTPPIHVVANGRADKLDFKSFNGEIALIPQREFDTGRFVYHQSAKPLPPPPPEPTQPEPTKVTDAPSENPDWN